MDINTDTPFWMFWLARIFGKKNKSESHGITMTYYLWRGDFWITNITEDL